MNNSTPKLDKTQVLEMAIKNYRQAVFSKSAAKFEQLPADTGYEVAIVGRSNAGKSTFLNKLTGQKSLAKTSKTPGRTQLMNVFDLAVANTRLVDLPGYGFAKVAHSMRFDWEKHLAEYFAYRQSLQGVIVLMDIRHPLQDLDYMMLEHLILHKLPIYILLTKSDKLSKNAASKSLNEVKNRLAETGLAHQVQTFSIQDMNSLLKVIGVLDQWLHLAKKED
jgi:GTP-binding protein